MVPEPNLDRLRLPLGLLSGIHIYRGARNVTLVLHRELLVEHGEWSVEVKLVAGREDHMELKVLISPGALVENGFERLGLLVALVVELVDSSDAGLLLGAFEFVLVDACRLQILLLHLLCGVTLLRLSLTLHFRLLFTI